MVTNSNKKVLYVTSDQFIQDFINTNKKDEYGTLQRLSPTDIIRVDFPKLEDKYGLKEGVADEDTID